MRTACVDVCLKHYGNFELAMMDGSSSEIAVGAHDVGEAGISGAVYSAHHWIAHARQGTIEVLIPHV